MSSYVPSDEQQRIVDAVVGGQNVQVVACAGAGKTSACLFIAQALTDKNILVLTYNRELASESNRRFREIGATNISCRTFHEYVGIVASQSMERKVTCKNDFVMLDCLHMWDTNGSPQAPPVDLLVMDETQDLRRTTFKILCHALPHNVQTVVMGDTKQLLYNYCKDDPADPKFLEEAPTFFESIGGARPWIRCTLLTSFRLTPNVATVVNAFWETNIWGGNHECPNIPVEYWVVDPYGYKLTSRLRDVLSSETSENVAFLNMANLNSDNGRRPIEVQLNRLSRDVNTDGSRLYNFDVRSREGEQRSDLGNKVRAWTFASSKGCTFDVVVVFGCSVYKDFTPPVNQFCTALSRARRRLILVHYIEYAQPQPFVPPLNNTTLAMWVGDGTVVCPDGVPDDTPMPKRKRPTPEPLAVTSMTHLSAVSLRGLLAYGVRCVIEVEGQPIPYTTCVPFHTGVSATVEDTSSIYGTAILMRVEYERTGYISMVERMLDPLELKKDERYTVDDIEQQVSLQLDVHLTPAELVHMDTLSQGKSMTCDTVMNILRGHRDRFPSLQGHGVCYHRSRDDEFNETYMCHVRSAYTKEHKTVGDFMLLANATLAFDGTHALFTQIGFDYDSWVDEEAFVNAYERLLDVIPSSATFEKDCTIMLKSPVQGPRRIINAINGRMDVAYDQTSMEIKLTSSLREEHELQNLQYAAMNCLSNDLEIGRSLLYNARTGGLIMHEIQRRDAQALLTATAQLKV